MTDVLIKEIFNKTVYIIQETINGDFSKYEELYLQYLNEKYAALLNDFISTESMDTVREIVDLYVSDETNYLKNLDKNGLLSLLEQDPDFEQLSFLSENAFDQVKECVKSGEFMSDERDYQKRLGELAQCLDGIKPHNIDAAKNLLSESILDIEYMFNKSDVKSLRLSRLI